MASQNRQRTARNTTTHPPPKMCVNPDMPSCRSKKSDSLLKPGYQGDRRKETQIVLRAALGGQTAHCAMAGFTLPPRSHMVKSSSCAWLANSLRLTRGQVCLDIVHHLGPYTPRRTLSHLSNMTQRRIQPTWLHQAWLSMRTDSIKCGVQLPGATR